MAETDDQKAKGTLVRYVDEHTRAVLSVATLCAMIAGAVLISWQAATIKAGIDNNQSVTATRLSAVEVAVEKLVLSTQQRYTSEDAARDWRTAEAVHSQIVDAIAALSGRVTRLEDVLLKDAPLPKPKGP